MDIEGDDEVGASFLISANANNRSSRSSSIFRNNEGDQGRDRKEKIKFIKEAFGFTTCCSLQSYSLIIAFSGMVYSCCIAGLSLFTLLLFFKYEESSESETLDEGVKRKVSPSFVTTAVLLLSHCILTTLLVLLTTRIFSSIAEMRIDDPGNFLHKIWTNTIFYSVLKLLSISLFIGLTHYPRKEEEEPSSPRLRLPPESVQISGVESPTTAALRWGFVYTDVGFSIVYIATIITFLKLRGLNSFTEGFGKEKVAVVKVGGELGLSTRKIGNFNFTPVKAIPSS